MVYFFRSFCLCHITRDFFDVVLKEDVITIDLSDPSWYSTKIPAQTKDTQEKAMAQKKKKRHFI